LRLQEIRELITRCWAPDPEARPSFEKIAAELTAILDKLPRKSLGGGGGGGGGCCSVS
jgi:hypothetical protein